MKVTDAGHERLVVAAQNGDARARAELVAAHLPLLYAVVGKALDNVADVDDVVQETMLRVVRDLPSLRDPESFRAWLVTIAIRQIGSHRKRQRVRGEHTVAVPDEDALPDAEATFEDATLLRLQITQQRRQVAEAGRWLDREYRKLMSLWWQENAGWLGRADVAAAMGLTVGHLGVRLQRMRDQLEQSRAIVAALWARPRCPELTTAVAGWNGRPNSVWRKRIARHIRGCEQCAATASGQIPVERLLLGVNPIVLAPGLADLLTAAQAGPAGEGAITLLGKTLGGLPGKLAGKVTAAMSAAMSSMAAHPVASVATAVVLVSAVAGGTLARPWSPSPQQPLTARSEPAPAATASAGAVVPTIQPTLVASVTPAGTAPNRPAVTAPPSVPVSAEPSARSLEIVSSPGRFLTSTGDFAIIDAVAADSGEQVKRLATFTVMAGFADPACLSLRASDGRYLRHLGLRLRLSADDGTALFREDATFCARPGAVAGSVTLQSHNYPGSVIVNRGDGIYIDGSNGTTAFGRESSFIIRSPWIS